MQNIEIFVKYINFYCGFILAIDKIATSFISILKTFTELIVYQKIDKIS